MWTEILFIWIDDVYELQVEMAKAGHHVTKHTFAYLKSFSIITIIIINNNSIDYSTNNIHEDRVNKCRKMAIRLLRPNTKPYTSLFLYMLAPTSSADSYFPEKFPFPKSMRCTFTHELASALRVSKTLEDQNLQLHCRT